MYCVKCLKNGQKSWLFWCWQCKTLVLIRIAVLILGEFLIKNWSFWAVKTLLGLAFDRFFIILLKTVKKNGEIWPFWSLLGENLANQIRFGIAKLQNSIKALKRKTASQISQNIFQTPIKVTPRSLESIGAGERTFWEASILTKKSPFSLIFSIFSITTNKSYE